MKKNLPLSTPVLIGSALLIAVVSFSLGIVSSYPSQADKVREYQAALQEYVNAANVAEKLIDRIDELAPLITEDELGQKIKQEYKEVTERFERAKKRAIEARDRMENLWDKI